MKFIYSIIFLSIQFVSLSQSNSFIFESDSNIQSTNLSVMTYNIRYNNPDDGTNAWVYRKEKVADLIQKYAPDILCVQEALKDQVYYLLNNLPKYSMYGVGRDDGIDNGEYSAIFYSKERFQIIESSTFWLSETPTIPGSMGWDAACTRIVSWVKVKDIPVNKTLYIFNTHFDHVGELARNQSAMLLLERINQIAGNAPVILAGDFNFTEESPVYSLLTSNSQFYQKQLYNSRVIATYKTGPSYTYIGFDFIGQSGDIIDHIFINDSFRVVQHQIVSDNIDGIYPSDHLPVMVEIKY